MKPAFVGEVKSPEESNAPWDCIEIIDTVPAENAFRSMEKSACPLQRR